MFIIIGLGNPGEKFVNTRHNAGFMVVDTFAKENDFPDFELSKKYDALISERNDIILVKPQTLMNKSGLAVKKIITHYKLPTTNLVVVHDDIDLPVGKMKIVVNRGSAGHKGVESVMKNIGKKGLIRLRLGIQPIKKAYKSKEDFVVKNFSEDELKVFKKTAKKAASALDSFIKNGLDKTMSEYNK